VSSPEQVEAPDSVQSPPHVVEAPPQVVEAPSPPHVVEAPPQVVEAPSPPQRDEAPPQVAEVSSHQIQYLNLIVPDANHERAHTVSLREKSNFETIEEFDFRFKAALNGANWSQMDVNEYMKEIQNPSAIPTPQSEPFQIIMRPFMIVGNDTNPSPQNNPFTVDNLVEEKANPPKRRKKTTRKKKKSPDQWKINIEKKKKESGRAYFSPQSKKHFKAKQQSPRHRDCRLKCYETLGNLRVRKKLFSDFYLQSKEGQNSFLLACRTLKSVVQQKLDATKPRNFTQTWQIHGTPVCLQAMKDIYDVTHYQLMNLKVIVKPSRKGIKNKDIKVRQQKYDAIDAHIMSFCAESSHYSRQKLPNRRYIQTENVQSVQAMFKLFRAKQKDDPILSTVTYFYYRNRFNTNHNLGFRNVPNDTCGVCDRHIATKTTDSVHFFRHKKFKEMACTQFNQDTADSRVKMNHEIPKTRTYVIDLGSVNYVPKLSTGAGFYSSKLSTYALIIYNMGDNNCTLCVWSELDAKRGVNEICSCIWKVLKDEPYVDHINLWFDNCGGQNKSSYNVAFSSWLMHQEICDTIEIKFLEIGATLNNCDRMAGVTENYLKTYKQIETPFEMYHLLSEAREKPSKFNVIRMIQSEFRNWKSLIEDYDDDDEFKSNLVTVLDQATNEEKIDGKQPKLNFHGVRQWQLSASSSTLFWFKYTFHKSEPYKYVEMKANPYVVALLKGAMPNQLYRGMLPLSHKKYEHLLKLGEYLSEESFEYYRSLPHLDKKQQVVTESPNVSYEPNWADEKHLSALDQFGDASFKQELDHCIAELKKKQRQRKRRRDS